MLGLRLGGRIAVLFMESNGRLPHKPLAAARHRTLVRFFACMNPAVHSEVSYMFSTG